MTLPADTTGSARRSKQCFGHHFNQLVVTEPNKDIAQFAPAIGPSLDYACVDIADFRKKTVKASN